MTLKFNEWPRKTIGHLFYTMSSFVHHFESIGEFKMELQFWNAEFGSKFAIFFVPCNIEIWWMTMENNRASLLYYVKRCASFERHGWIQTEVIVRESWMRENIDIFAPCDLEIRQMTRKSKRSPFLYYLKLCASFQSQWCTQTWATVRKRSIRVKICGFFVPCDREIWQTTLKNDRTPLLYSYKLCAPFRAQFG